MDASWKLQQGDRSEAYRCMYDRVVNELRERNIKQVVIKGSVVPPKSLLLSHLLAAELRGVIASAAAQAQAQPKTITKATMSRTFGTRTTDEYVSDADFWDDAVSGKLRSGSRETALLILMANKP